ncbi:MAG: hypothetical protein CMN78_03300 [Spirochaetales bacterium]|nr:hypothetical protein [Spirochaetales bacterium]
MCILCIHAGAFRHREGAMMEHRLVSCFVALFVAAVFGFASGGTETSSSGAGATGTQEAPMLAEMVEAGTLPPLEERLPEDAQVVKPVDSVGTYGGTLNIVDMQGFNDIHGLVKHGLFALAQDFGTADHSWYDNMAAGKIVPDIAKDGVFSNGFRTFTLHLRKGMKWSDGVPVTADDYLFWWEDIVLNEEVTADVPSVYRPGGELMKVSKVDDFALEFDFAKPNRFFTYYLCVTAVQQTRIRPKHYLEQFHIKYNENAQKLATDNGFDNWYEYFQNRGGSLAGNEYVQNPDLPTIFPWKTVEYRPELWIAERNPYYWKVDTDGNQLPYFDKIVAELSENAEVLLAKVLAGRVDYSAAALQFTEIPILKDTEKNGDFTTYLWDMPMGAMPSILINQSFPVEIDPYLRGLFKDVRFRQALSVAINRDEANKVAYFGVSYPAQAGALPGSRFSKPAFLESYAQYDTNLANELLDNIGLPWDSNRKFRLRQDNGEPLTVIIEDVDVGVIRGYSKIRPLLKEYWEAVGVRTILKELEVSLWVKRFFAGQVHISMWGIDSIDDFNFQILGPWFIPGTSYGGSTWHAHAWHQWVSSGGEQGEEPPAEVMRMRELWLQMQDTTDEAEITRLGKEIFRIQSEQLFVLGVVGSMKQPIALKNNIKNFPADGVWANNTSLMDYGWSFQWYFE